MKRILSLFLLALGCLLYSQDNGNKHYVATLGNDNSPGTFDQPWATWQKAFTEAKPGDTVFFRGGVYYSKQTNVINPKDFPVGRGTSGTRENPIVYMSYPGEWAILDCMQHCTTTPDPGWDIYNAGISLSYVEHIHFKDFEIRNVFQCDSVITGGIDATFSRNLTFEHIIMHDVGQRGYWILGGAWKTFYDDSRIPGHQYYMQVPLPYWETEEDSTRWINCDVYNLADTLSVAPGNAADAWKTVHYRGNVVIWDGCRAWNYSDDAWDPTNGNGALRVLNNCWAMASNKYLDMSDGWDTERNGFKTSSSQTYALPEGTPDPYITNHYMVMTNCLAVYCTKGFYEIDLSSGGRYYNNTSAFNGIGWGSSQNGFGDGTIVRNNIVYGSTAKTAMNTPYECSFPNDYTESNNTWVKTDGYPWFKMSLTLAATESDFITTDSLEIVSIFTAPRKQDGSLPDIKPLMLSSSSRLIDAGTDVGLSYNGSAPDIGASEYGKVPGTSNYYPSVKFTSPSSGSIFTKPCSVNLNVTASDPDGYISKVEFFYNDTIKVGERLSPPWSVDWENPMVGSISLRAVATDNEGARTTSDREWIAVLPGSQNLGNSGFLYPNPNNGLFTLLLSEPLSLKSELSVTSLDGRTVYSIFMLPEEISKQFDLSFLSPGMYIITLFNNKILLANKFIKL